MSGIPGLTKFGLSFTSIRNMLSKLPTNGVADFENAKEYPNRNHLKMISDVKTFGYCGNFLV